LPGPPLIAAVPAGLPWVRFPKARANPERDPQDASIPHVPFVIRDFAFFQKGLEFIVKRSATTMLSFFHFPFNVFTAPRQ
jgi:hypothetical protein